MSTKKSAAKEQKLAKNKMQGAARSGDSHVIGSDGKAENVDAKAREIAKFAADKAADREASKAAQSAKKTDAAESKSDDA